MQSFKILNYYGFHQKNNVLCFYLFIFIYSPLMGWIALYSQRLFFIGVQYMNKKYINHKSHLIQTEITEYPPNMHNICTNIRYQEICHVCP